MSQNEINFKQEREFGDLFNATFAFIGSEFKKLGTAILYFVLPLLLIAALVGAYAGMEQQQAIQQIQSGTAAYNNPLDIFGSVFNIYFFINILATLAATTILTCTILGYIKLYVRQGKDGFTLTEVWREVIRYFFPVLGTSIITGIIVGFGFAFCFLPGVYLGVSLSLILPILVLEGKGFGDAFSRSFKLVKPNFWMILGALIVIFIIVYLLSIIFSIPALIMGLKSMFFNLKQSQDINFNFGISYYIYNGISSLLTYIVGAIPTIFLALLYYSQVETYEKPSLNEKIEQLSTDE